MKELNEAQGFSFPTTLEVSALGASDAGLQHIVPDVLAAVGVDVIVGSLRIRPSREGRYMSVTVAFLCADRATYDAVQLELRAHPAVKWTI